MSDTDAEVQHRARREASADEVAVREEVDQTVGAGEEWYAIRMPISSTAEARDGEAFTRDRLEGWVRQIEDGTIPVFADHGRNSGTGSRYSAFGKLGYYANPEIESRDGVDLLVADTVVMEPSAVHEGAGFFRTALAILKSQAEAGMPLTASVGWAEDTGDRDLPGDSDLLEGSIVGIPSDAQASTEASAEPVVARAVSAASSDFDLETFERELRRLTRELPDTVVDELGDLLEPNAGAIEAAQQALDWYEEYPDEFGLGSEDGEGISRARMLVDHEGERLTGTNEDDNSYWVEIENFHSRHHPQDNHLLDDEYEDEPWRDPGYVAHKLWGGDEGYDQAQDVVAALEALADDDDVDYTMSRDAITQETVKEATPVHVDGEAEPTEGDRGADTPDDEDTMSDDSNDTEPDGENESGADDEPTLRGMEEKLAEMREQMEENTRMTREMHEEMMSDGENAEDGDDEDEDEDEDDDMDEESADADEERSVTIDGEEYTEQAARELLAARAGNESEPSEPKTSDRADGPEDGEERDADEGDSADTDSSGSFWS